MKDDREMSEAEKRLAFRFAVNHCLVTFYGQTRSKSEMLVDGWWNRISTTSSFVTGLFMHAEPINVAARIADKEVVEIDHHNAATYSEILQDSRRAALLCNSGSKTPRKPSGKAMKLRVRQLA